MSGDVIQDARRARASHIHAYQTIAMLREHLAESQLETREAREVRADEEPWIWCDDDTAQTVQTMGNRMTARISGGHLRALLRDAHERGAALHAESNACLRTTNSALRAAVRDLEKMLDIAKGKG